MSRLARNLSDLPTAASQRKTSGWAPDAAPRFGPLLVEAWHAEGAAHDANLPNAVEGARFRHSDAGACSRAIAYAALGVPASNPMDAVGHFITTQGHLLHDAFQKVLATAYPGADIELKVGEGFQGGHVDAVVRVQPKASVTVPGGPLTPHAKVVAIEAKSMDGFPYKMAVGERGEPQGPKYDHVIQAALNGDSAGADEICIVYLTRGAVSVQAAARSKRVTEMMRVTAEWTLQRNEYLPIAYKEIERIEAILNLLDDERTLPARKIPDPELPLTAVITDPRKGVWTSLNAEGLVEDAGTTWQCAYCKFQDLCVKTPSERTSTEVLHEIGAL